MKVRDVLKRLNDEGWTLVRVRGSHRQFRHESRPHARVTVPGHPGDDLTIETLRSIYV
jgi:predicted RNA binding protein YcfA (HicA-like mRNA interferase family)